MTPLEDRRALEALRNGVPNRAAINALGCSQPAIEEEFLRRLDRMPERLEAGRQEPGLLVAGDFGTGKSHLLGYLAELARQRNYVCSRVVISKETPLYDPGKVFRAAIEAAELPDARGLVLQEISSTLSRMKLSSEYARLYQWTNDPDAGLWPGFAATLKVWENPPDEASGPIVDFWGGQPLRIADLRRWLRQSGLASAFSVPTIRRAELPPQNLRFASRLFDAAGYAGWVVLLDEVELIGRYGSVSRARSYAELARWLGLSQGGETPGLFVVAAITEDFDAMVIQGKQDRELAAERLSVRNDVVAAARVDHGMRAVREAKRLQPPDDALLSNTQATLREIHGRAYRWTPPAISVGHGRLTRHMRAHIRQWITEWDLDRFYPGGSHEVQSGTLTFSYEDDPDVIRDDTASGGTNSDGDNGTDASFAP